MQVCQSGEGRVRESAVDWLTATARGERNRSWFDAHSQSLLEGERSAGNDLRTWDWQGYTGWACGQVSFGVRPDTHLVRLTGTRASSSWQEWEGHADNVSRVDLAVTIHLPSPIADLAATTYQQAVRSAEQRGAALRCSLITNNEGGATAYLGSRASDRFARCYDKYAESGRQEYAGCWRYELELKRGPARQTTRWLQTQADIPTAIRSGVWNYYHERGVWLPFARGGLLALPTPIAHVTDDERRLTWLREQVSFVVLGLMTSRPHAEVLDALGLAHLGG